MKVILLARDFIASDSPSVDGMATASFHALKYAASCCSIAPLCSQKFMLMPNRIAAILILMSYTKSYNHEQILPCATVP